jgi:hypothetical protein
LSTRPPSSPDPSPEAEKTLRKFFGVFIATLFLYITIYGGCEAYRSRGGPWNITFDVLPGGTPQLRIEHPRILPGGPVKIDFPGEVAPRVTNGPITYVYRRPNTNSTPFGPVIFVDTTTLPGNVTLNAFGHVVEMVPRTLFVNLHEVPWSSGTNMVLNRSDRPDPQRIKGRGQDWSGR